MSVAAALATFQAAVSQADSLIANAHKVDVSGSPFLSTIDRKQITVAAFLNIYIAWETFLEDSLSHLLSGSPTISGNPVVKFASPPDPEAAKLMLIGTQRFFDYANHTNISKIVNIYFLNGSPFQPHIDSIFGYLDDLRKMRNASAHISSTTQSSIESLALRLLGRPSPGIELYDLLTAPLASGRSSTTVLETYKGYLLATANLIANG